MADDWQRKFEEWKRAKRLREERERAKGIADSDIVKEVVNRPKVNEESVLREVGETLELKRGPRWEKILIACIYGIVGIVILYFVLASFFPQVFHANSYTIDAKDSTFLDSLSSFYIDSGVLGDKEVINDKTVRMINSAKPFNLVFKPKTKTTAQNGLLELDFILNGTGSNIYLDNKLVFPNLENYNLAYENDDDYVYVRSDLDDLTNWNVSADFTEDFIYENLPSSGVWSTRMLNPVDVELDDYKQETTLINTTFRDNLRLAVYAEGSLSINFTKQDLNWYLGSDEYNVSVSDSSGNIIFNSLYEDDGDKLASNKLGVGQNFSINLDDLARGIYYVDFVKDANNKASDSTISNLKINSNKILIVGAFLPMDRFSFYQSITLDKSDGFLYWWNGKDQVLEITGNIGHSIDLNNSWLNKRYDENFTKGDYTITTPIGYLWIYADSVSPSKANWFNLPFKQDETFNNQDILVISKQTLDDFGNLKIDKNIIDGKFGANVRVLDSGKVYFEKAKLSLYN